MRIVLKYFKGSCALSKVKRMDWTCLSLFFVLSKCVALETTGRTKQKNALPQIGNSWLRSYISDLKLFLQFPPDIFPFPPISFQLFGARCGLCSAGLISGPLQPDRTAVSNDFPSTRHRLAGISVLIISLHIFCAAEEFRCYRYHRGVF